MTSCQPSKPSSLIGQLDKSRRLHPESRPAHAGELVRVAQSSIPWTFSASVSKWWHELLSSNKDKLIHIDRKDALKSSLHSQCNVRLDEVLFVANHAFDCASY